MRFLKKLVKFVLLIQGVASFALIAHAFVWSWRFEDKNGRYPTIEETLKYYRLK